MLMRKAGICHIYPVAPPTPDGRISSSSNAVNRGEPVKRPGAFVKLLMER
jgi:hypothetical protein